MSKRVNEVWADKTSDGIATRVIVKSSKRGHAKWERGESGCYFLPVMSSGEGVFIRRDKYSTREVSSRESRERNK